MVTIHDVAREAGVSLATVSRVVNHSLVVSQATREKVLEAIEKVGYQPPVRSGSGRKQILVITDVSDADFSNSLYHSLADLGYQMFVFYNCEQSDPQQDLLRFLQQQSGISGIILHNFVRPAGEELFAVLNAYPVVQIDTWLPFDNTVTLGINHFQAAYDATEHLISAGCRKIVLLGGLFDLPPEAGYPRIMKNGYRSALMDAGQTPDPALAIECDFTIEGVYAGVRSFLAEGNSADGFVCAMDTIALGCMRALQDSGLHVPEDAKVISLMSTWCSAFTTPSLTALDYPREALSQELAQQMDLLLSGQPGGGRRIYLPHRFLYRESTGSL
ncbi:MAG: LacI family DNA-binding transcriptional regulator [Oscillospiraceae bacterium]|nr:LacI family DNA-binding transcriptional regulator [Oscillospiraceae bacterium]